MIHFELLQEDGIVIVTPEGRLASSDFENLANEVDPYIEEHRKLNGLMICVKSFPGWKDFAALLAHFTFVKNHHRHIAKVAAVTDSGFLAILPQVADHFVKAKVKHFDYDARESALSWLRDDSD